MDQPSQSSQSRAPRYLGRIKHYGELTAAACFWIVIGPCLMVYYGAGCLVKHCCPSLHEWSADHRDREKDKRRDKAFRRKFCGPEGMVGSSDKEIPPCPPPRPSVPIGKGSKKKCREPATPQPKGGDSFFDVLPAEIRNQIVMDAFGGRTIHLDLQFRRSYGEYVPKDEHASNMNFLLHDSEGRRYNAELRGRKKWRWGSFVCHHLHEGVEPVWLSYGRLAVPQRTVSIYCHYESNQCYQWPGNWPSKCLVGVMGWLLSCRQAYFEARNILYSANTFNIDAPVLLRAVNNIIPRLMSVQIRSLALAWDLNEVDLDQGFCYRTFSQRGDPFTKPLFPSLRHLALYLFTSQHEVLEWVSMEPVPWEDRNAVSQKLYGVFFPRVEEVLERVAPAGTEVTLTLSDWKLYEAIDMRLVSKQGKGATRLQKSEHGGLKCWKKVHPKHGMISGYWIHIGTSDMRLERISHHGNTRTRYDWKRHKLYNLGRDKYVQTAPYH